MAYATSPPCPRRDAGAFHCVGHHLPDRCQATTARRWRFLVPSPRAHVATLGRCTSGHHLPDRGQGATRMPSSRRRGVPLRWVATAIPCRIAAVTSIAPCPRRDAGAFCWVAIRGAITCRIAAGPRRHDWWRWWWFAVAPCPRRDAGAGRPVWLHLPDRGQAADAPSPRAQVAMPGRLSVGQKKRARSLGTSPPGFAT